MKANELRIGNLVKHNSVNREVLAIDRTRVYLRNNNSCDAFFYKDINGILITKEWLENLGFISDGYHEFKLGDLFLDCEYTDRGEWVVYIDQTSKNDKYVKRVYPKDEVKHVHQLQNLYFALTGEELCYE